MKTRTLATVVILICSFLLAPGVLRADENDWYQGQQGHWQQQNNNWKWGSTHGDEWYQGERGHWYRDKKGWHWYGNGGDEYRQSPKGWQWYGRK